MSMSSLARSVLDPKRSRPQPPIPKDVNPGLKTPLGMSASFLGWDTSQTLLSCVNKLVNSLHLPVTFLHERICEHHIVMVTFILRNHQTNICIEFKELQGGVRATSILCLLGIGLGLGSVLLYKLCSKILTPNVNKGKKRPASLDRCQEASRGEHLPETPDSGISTGTTLTPTVSSCLVTPDSQDAYLGALTHIGAPPHAANSHPQLYPNHLHPGHRYTFSSSGTSDQGFVSGNFTSGERLNHNSDYDSVRSVPGCHHDGQLLHQDLHCRNMSADHIHNGRAKSYSPRHVHSLPISQYNSFCDSESCCPQDISSDYANFELGNHSAFHSTPHCDYDSGRLGQNGSLHGSFSPQRPYLRRNHHSVASDMSGYSDYSARESLMGKGYSIDCGESLSCLDNRSDLFENESNQSSASNMDHIRQEIQMIRSEISEMNEKVQVLSSRENIHDEIFMLTPDPMKDTEFSHSQSLRVLRKRKTPVMRERKLSGSCNQSVDGDAEDNSQWRRSYHHTGEFMWDYQSDLASEDANHFVAKRPILNDSILEDGIDYSSPTFDHVRKYIESCCNSHNDSSPVTSRKYPKASRTFNSITDMYIDDNFSECGDFLQTEERFHPDGCLDESSSAPSNELKQNELLHQQLSFNKSFDCDKNGNPDITNCSNDPSHRTCSKHSMCLECGSPSHRLNCGAVSSLSSGSGSQYKSSNLLESCPNCGHKSSTESLETTFQKNKRRKWEVKNIRNKVNVFEYAEKSIKGDPASVNKMKKGYHQIHGLLGMSQLRPIRSDNYCALRATLYQVCVNNFPILKHIGSRENTFQKLQAFLDPQTNFLQNWNFANRLPYAKDLVLDRIRECLNCFYDKMETLSEIPSPTAREAAFSEIVNFDPDTDLELLEAIKALMMLEALDMYEAYSGLSNKKVPVFAWLMYSRESSENPEALFLNHINPLGDTRNAQQVELFLLGYTLGVKIEIVRPPHYGQEDFICHYPDDGADGFPKVYLVAEDDLHYHAIMP